jgi:hypothetical protein
MNDFGTFRSACRTDFFVPDEAISAGPGRLDVEREGQE